MCRLRNHLLLLSAVVCLLQCTDSPQVNPTVEYDWPPATRRYQASDLNSVPPLTADLAWVAGDGDDGETFYEVRGMALDDEHNVYVLAADGVRVLGSHGRALTSFGRRGRGPGELWNPRGIAIGGDTVFILDDAVKIFGLDGQYRGQLASRSGTYLTAHDIRYTNHGLATFRWRMQRPRGAETSTDTLEVRLLNVATGEESWPITQVPFTLYRLSKTGLEGSPVMGARPSVAITAEAQTIVSDPQSFTVQVTTHKGRILDVVVADLPRVPTTRNDYRDAIASVINGAGYPPEIADALLAEYANAPRASYRPAIARLLASLSGNLLIQRHDISERPYDRTNPAGQSVWLAIDGDWRSVGSLTLPTRFVPVIFDQCTIVGQQRDTLDVLSIARYDIIGYPDLCS